MTRPTTSRRGRALGALALAGALALTGCAGGGTSGALDGTQLLQIPREDTATFSRNFNPFSPNAAPMTQQAIYESMLVFNPNDGTTTPWLATEWTPAPDGTGITFTLRDGVQWSDGEPFTAADVAFTFELQKEVAGGFEYLDTVTAEDDDTVTFTFTTPFAPALYELGRQVIVPEHVWESIDDAGSGDERDAGRHRPVHGGHQLREPGLQPREEPELLAARQAEDRGHPDAGLRRQRPREPGDHQRGDGLGRPVHPRHRERVRRRGPGPPALLVPGDRRR